MAKTKWMEGSNTLNKQVKWNFYSNVVFLICSILVGLYYTPYLVNKLGIIRYGVIPLTLLINQYITVFTGSLTSALSRFLAISLQKKRYAEASSYISSAVGLITLIIILLCPIIYLFISNIDKVFTIPHELLVVSKYLFWYTVGSFFLSLYSSIFNISQYAFNRLDRLNLLKILRYSLKLLGVIVCFELLSVNLIYVGLINFLTEGIVLLGSFLFYKLETRSKVKISLKCFKFEALYAMLAMAAWTMIHQFGDTTLYQMDVFFVNRFFGTYYSGIIGAFISFGTYVIVIVSVISSLFGPIILKAYSDANYDKLVDLTIQTSFIVGATSSVIVGVLLGFSKQFISNWLGGEFSVFNLWMILKLVWLPFYASAGIFAFVFRAHNKVKYPAIITLLIGLSNVCFTYLIYYFNKDNPDIINLALVISGVLAVGQSYVLNICCFNSLYAGNLKVITKNTFRILFALIASLIVSFALSTIITTNNLIVLLFILACITLLFLLFFIFIALKKNEKELIFMLLK